MSQMCDLESLGMQIFETRRTIFFYFVPLQMGEIFIATVIQVEFPGSHRKKETCYATALLAKRKAENRKMTLAILLGGESKKK